VPLPRFGSVSSELSLVVTKLEVWSLPWPRSQYMAAIKRRFGKKRNALPISSLPLRLFRLAVGTLRHSSGNCDPVHSLVALQCGEEMWKV
jgi:hypothetical protein